MSERSSNRMKPGTLMFEAAIVVDRTPRTSGEIALILEEQLGRPIKHESVRNAMCRLVDCGCATPTPDGYTEPQDALSEVRRCPT